MNDKINKKRIHEKKVIADMITIYCNDIHHTTKDNVCSECDFLIKYAAQRSDNCPFIEHKTFCSNCSVHCYKPEIREKIKIIMRHSGPRMIYHHPITAIKHLTSTIIERQKIKKLNV